MTAASAMFVCVGALPLLGETSRLTKGLGALGPTAGASPVIRGFGIIGGLADASYAEVRICGTLTPLVLAGVNDD